MGQEEEAEKAAGGKKQKHQSSCRTAEDGKMEQRGDGEAIKTTLERPQRAHREADAVRGARGQSREGRSGKPEAAEKPQKSRGQKEVQRKRQRKQKEHIFRMTTERARATERAHNSREQEEG